MNRAVLRHLLRMLPLALVVLSACASLRSVAPREAVRAVVISDLNASYGSTGYPAEVRHAMRHITETWRPDLVLVSGDMVAGQAPRLADSTVRAMWQAFDSVVAAPLRAAGIPLVPTMGNHDASAYPAHARDRRIAIEYWRNAPQVPSTSPAGHEHYPLRHSHRYGDVFVVAWDGTNQESGTSEELLEWLRRELTSEAASTARHRVVLSHLPLYGVATGRDRPGEVLADGDALRRRLEEWGATLFVSGHHHAYFPGRRGRLELLHAGALGNGPRELVGSAMPPRKTVSVLDFLPDSLAITTFHIDSATGARAPVPLTELPRFICGSNGWVTRRDVVAVHSPCSGSTERR